jgi:hypothetical protein
MKFITSLPKKDFQNLKYALSLGSDSFNIFYENLDENGQQYLSSLLLTYQYDILDYALMLNYTPSEEVLDLINKCK